MADKKQKSEPEFIRGTVLASILLLLIFIAAGVVFARNPDAVRGAAVRTLSSLGNFSAAAELAGDMDGDEAQAQSLYHVAEKMLSGGSFEEAAELFKSLGEYSDSAAKYLEAEYAYADALYNDGSYERAMEVFSAVSAYGDAAERQKACVYAMAAEAYEGGEYLRASTLFAGLSSYADAQERAFDAALRITGDADAAAVIVSSGGLSAEAAEKAADIAMLRSSLPLGRLAVGSYHTVYIRDDGTAAACGDNSDGRCDVSGWTELVQVCAGAKHTAALRADGTVVAAGDDSYGQCDVGDWRNVIAIAAGEYDTVALLADGSIVSCGYHSYDSLKGADQNKRIFAGSYGAAAVNSLGQLVSSNKSITAENAQLLLELPIGTGCHASLYADGRLVSSVLGDEVWEDIVQADISPRALLAVDGDGNIRSRFFRESDSVEFPVSGRAVLCGAGTEHYVFVLEDGSLAAFGDNSYGQCDVQKLAAKAAKD